MRKLLLLAVVLLTPSTAFAHPGHEHVVSEGFHHTFEVVLATIVVALGVAAFAWHRRRAKADA